MTALGDLDRTRIGELRAREVARFQQDRPRSLAMVARARAHMPNGAPMAWMAYYDEQPVYIDHGQGAGFTDIDGLSYLDFNASDMSMFCGHANPAIVAAVCARARATMASDRGLASRNRATSLVCSSLSLARSRSPSAVIRRC